MKVHHLARALELAGIAVTYDAVSDIAASVHAQEQYEKAEHIHAKAFSALTCSEAALRRNAAHPAPFRCLDCNPPED